MSFFRGLASRVMPGLRVFCIPWETLDRTPARTVTNCNRAVNGMHDTTIEHQGAVHGIYTAFGCSHCLIVLYGALLAGIQTD